MKGKAPRGMTCTPHLTCTPQRPSTIMTRMRTTLAPKPKLRIQPRAKAAERSGGLAAGVAAADAAAAPVQAASVARARRQMPARPMRILIGARRRITLRSRHAAGQTMRVLRMVRAHASGKRPRRRNRPSRSTCPGESRHLRSQASRALSSARLVARAAPRKRPRRLAAGGGVGRGWRGRLGQGFRQASRSSNCELAARSIP